MSKTFKDNRDSFNYKNVKNANTRSKIRQNYLDDDYDDKFNLRINDYQSKNKQKLYSKTKADHRRIQRQQRDYELDFY